MQSVESLRHTKVMNAELESLLTSRVKQIESEATKEVVDELEKYIDGKIKTETRSLLERGVERYFDFDRKGGLGRYYSTTKAR